MKEILSSTSFKIKYLITLLVVLFFVSILIFVLFMYTSSSINSDKVFMSLVFSEVLLILLITNAMYNITRNDSLPKNVFDIVGDDNSFGSSIFNAISDGIIVVDRKGNVKNVNQGLCNIMGLEEKHILNKNLYNLLNACDRSNDEKLLPWIVIESLETQKEFRQKEEIIVRNSEMCYLAVSTYMIRNKSKRIIGVLAIVHDFTQKRKLEQQLQHVEKLATAGQMAAELAHEIKNPICSIRGLIQIIKKKHFLGDNKYYEIIISEIDRINVLLQGFLTFTQNKPKFEKISINHIIEEILPLIESYADSKSINVIVDMQKQIPCINADGENIRQVIINIVQNGIDALHRNGRMSISIWYDQINELVKMEFKDNGGGIKPEYLDKIFEPFFTTKDNGTGLGLAISQKIIENHYGKLFAFNNLDGGATFVIELPVAKSQEINNN